MKVLILVLICSFCTISIHAQTESQESSTQAVASQSEEKSETTATDFIKKTETAGDFRYRFQFIDTPTTEQQRVNRIMFRVGQTFQVQSDLKIVYRLMTATTANSGNVTLGDSATSSQGSQRQYIGLDLAFANYSPAKDLSLFIGKFPHFAYFPGKNQVILDRDVTGEGGGLQYKFGITEELTSTVNLASSWVRKKYDSAIGQDLNDSMLNVAQLNLGYKFSDFQFLVGYGLFNYSDVQNSQPTDLYPGTVGASKGNTLSGGRYVNGYEINQAYAELKWQQKPFDVSLFAEFDQNTKADTLNKASVYGLTFGWDKWSLSYMFQKIESDAVLALFTDGEFAGGNTNSDGSIITVNYKLSKNAAAAVTHFINRRTIATTPTDYTRTHADLTFSF